MKHAAIALACTTLFLMAATPAMAADEEGDEGFSVLDIPGNIIRGAINFFTSPAEIARNCSYESSMSGATGYATGTVYGIGYTVGRAFLGVVDVATLGLTGDNLYASEQFPEYVWDAPWTTANEQPPRD